MTHNFGVISLAPAPVCALIAMLPLLFRRLPVFQEIDPMRPIPQFGSSNPDKNSRHLDAPSRPRFVGLLIALTIASVAPPAQARQVLLVATGPNSAGQYSVGQYDATTGGAINASFINGLINPLEFAVDGNNHLFVVNNGNNTVGEYDATTGATINATFSMLPVPRGF